MTSSASESIRYRIRRAKDTLVEAQAMAPIGHWNACVNRLYHACFYAVTALLLQRNLLTSKHTQVRSLLNVTSSDPEPLRLNLALCTTGSSTTARR